MAPNTRLYSGKTKDARQSYRDSLCVTLKYIVLGSDDARLHVYGLGGTYKMTLKGRAKGVWTTAVFEDTLICSGFDYDVRASDLATG